MTSPKSTPPASSSRRWTRAEKILGFITAVLALAAAVLGLQKELIAQQKNEAVQTIQRKAGDLSALQSRFDQIQNQYNNVYDENKRLRQQLGLPASPPSNTGVPGSQQTYLSEINAVDHDGKSETGTWDSGLRTINQIQYGHSIGMNAGCQNSDGGDFWIDYSLDGSWQRLRASIGVSDRSSTQSKATFKILNAITGAEVTHGEITAGPPIDIDAPILGIVRLRLFINDSNSPAQSCGFENIKTAVVWGDALLVKS